MPLNDREEAALRALEQQMSAEDPKLAARLGGRPPVTAKVRRPSVRYGAGVAAGLASMPIAADTGLYVLGVAGYVLATICVTRLFERLGRPDTEHAPAASRPTSGR